MKVRRSIGDPALVGAAFGGVVLGHWMSYLLAIPIAGERNGVLVATGHGYWLTAIKLAVVLAVVSLAAIGIRQARLAWDRGTALDHGPGSIALRLTLLQVLGFVALEVTERLAAGAPLSSLAAHQVLVLGVLVQVLIAGSLALLLSLFARAVHAAVRAAHARARSGGRARSSFPPIAFAVLRPALLTGSVIPRGPPPR